MTDLLITTHEILRAERSTPVTSKPMRVRFPFDIGYEVFFTVTAEVTEERDGDGRTGHDVTILGCVQKNGNAVMYPYEKGMETLRAALEQRAIERYNNAK